MKMMNSKNKDFRVLQMVYLLIPLCRGGRGCSSGHGGVGNGGLWWLEWISEGARVVLQWLGLCCLGFNGDHRWVAGVEGRC